MNLSAGIFRNEGREEKGAADPSAFRSGLAFNFVEGP
jgi:hypothetical protein